MVDVPFLDQAARQLEALGPKVLPGLRKARVNADPEVRRRLDDLIPALETSARPVSACDCRARASSQSGFRFGRLFFQLHGDYS